jgi:hypothetical protein
MGGKTMMSDLMDKGLVSDEVGRRIETVGQRQLTNHRKYLGS